MVVAEEEQGSSIHQARSQIVDPARRCACARCSEERVEPSQVSSEYDKKVEGEEEGRSAVERGREEVRVSEKQKEMQAADNTRRVRGGAGAGEDERRRRRVTL
eukprot:766253-Hanusia_phi.AAC.1